MKAVVLERAGQLSMSELKGPESCGADEAVLRIRSVGICGTDLHAFCGNQPFFTYPRILGHELGAEIERIGENGAGLRAGDRCAIEPYINCGRCFACRQGRTNCCAELEVLGVHRDGGMQEQLVVPISKLHKSATLSFDQLALAEMLSIGMHAVERAALRSDDTALVVGAGPIGLTVIQFLRLAGLGVAVMDVNEKRLNHCRKAWGIDDCISAAASPLEALLDLHHGEMPTVVFDCTGNGQSMMNAFRYVSHGGKLVFVGLFTGNVTFHDPFFHSHELTLYSSRNSTGREFRRILRLMESGIVNVEKWVTDRIQYTALADHLAHCVNGGGEFRKAVVEW